MNTRTLTLAAAAVAALLSAPALATDHTLRVAYGDLNLATAEGQAVLQHRLDDAAHKVCRFDGNGLATPQQADECFREAHKSAAIRFAEAVSEKRRG